jgi:hypothetical protein
MPTLTFNARTATSIKRTTTRAEYFDTEVPGLVFECHPASRRAGQASTAIVGDCDA